MLRANVEARAGRTVFVEGARADAFVSVTFTPTEQSGWTALLAARGASDEQRGERTLESADPDCSALDEAVVLVVSTFVGVSMAELDVAPETEPEPAPSPPDATPTPSPRALAVQRDSAPPPPARRTRAPSEPFRLRAALGAELDSGTLPKPAFGLGAGVFAQTPTLSLSLGGLILPRADFGFAPGADARFRALLARLEACANTLPGGALRVDVCVGARAGRLLVRTRGLVENADNAALFVAIELSVRISWQPVGARLSPYAALGALLPARSVRFYYESAAALRDDYHTTIPGVFVGLGTFIGPPS